MGLALRRRAKSWLLRLRPPHLVAAFIVIVLGLVVVGALRSGQTPEPGLASVREVDAALLEALNADPNGVLDSDRDGLRDTVENFVYGTDPHRHNTSGSRIPDGWLVRYGLDPFDPSIENRPAAGPPFSVLPPAYGNRWPPAYALTIWDVYNHSRPQNWSETEQGAFFNGLDPTDWDHNDDGIADGFLIRHGLDPKTEDIGEQSLAGPQGLTVLQAYQHRTDPRAVDTDKDGLGDRQEIAGPDNPRAASGVQKFPPTDPARFDTSGSGVCDGFLVSAGLDPTRPELAYGDPDRDGATTLDEYNWSVSKFGAEAVCRGSAGLDAMDPTSGTSVLLDGWLIRYGFNPLDADAATRVTQTSDTDPRPAMPPDPAGCPAQAAVRLTVYDEYNHSRPSDWDESLQGPWWGGTDPSKADTDGDGIGDAIESMGYCVVVVGDPVENRTVTYRTRPDATRRDTDGDGLTDGEEASPSLRTGPARAAGVLDARRRDTDFDGLDDVKEISIGLGLDPTRVDSAGDLLRDGERLRLLDARADQASGDPDAPYPYSGDPNDPRTIKDAAEGLPGWRNASGATPSAKLRALFGPSGDADADGTPNIMEKDADEDGLLNGWEVHTEFYAFSPFGLGSLQARAETDPLNPDTDGDRLLDGWEVRYGQADFIQGRYNLDPADWDSDDDGLGDGAEDPDEDTIEWYTFDGPRSAPVARNHTFSFSNADEQRYGTDPNKFDTDEDELADGWKVFWGLEYPRLGSYGAVYPGAPGPLQLPLHLLPQPGTPQPDVLLRTIRYDRFLLDPEAAQPGEQAVEQIGQIPLPGGGTRTVHHFVGQLQFRFQDAQAAKTNPFMVDTDGDRMEDAWEILHAAPLADPEVLSECVTEPRPDPVRFDGSLDPDEDGLINALEFLNNADPLCPDTDLGGIGDGSEIQFSAAMRPFDPRDDKSLIEGSSADSDCDGIPDGRELVPADRSLPKTDPLNPDMDGDGLLDGADHPSDGGLDGGADCTRFLLDAGVAYRRQDDGTFVFRGEQEAGTNPLNSDDFSIGVPAGWLAAHNMLVSPSAESADYYRFAIPEFWNHKVHGPWWGGADPNLTGTADPDRTDLQRLAAESDPDHDGLVDHDGFGGYEDPFPGSNGPNRLRSIARPASLTSIPYPVPGTDPANTTLPTMQRRLQAQAMLNERDVGPLYVAFQRPASIARTTPCLGVDGGPGRVVFKGMDSPVTGNVTNCATRAGIPGITVEARMGDPVQLFGVGVTDADGRFVIPLNIQAAANFTMPANSLIFRGQQGGAVEWTADPSAVAPGPNTVLVRTYATPQAAYLPGAPNPPLASKSFALGVSVKANTRVSASLPEVVLTGGTFNLDLQEADSGGAPLSDPLVVSWLGTSMRLVPDPDGFVSVVLAAPHDARGDQTIRVRSEPSAANRAYVMPADENFTVSLRNPTELLLDPVPAVIDAGQPLVCSGRVLGPTGPLNGAGVQVELRRAGLTVSNAGGLTTSGGRYSLALPIPPDAAPGEYVLVATAAESGELQASQNETSVQVRGLPRFVDVSTDNLTLGQPALVAGRLVEPNGDPLANSHVVVQLGETTQALVTDEDGAFRSEFPMPGPAGLVGQTLRFDADAAHTGSQRFDQRLVVSGSRLELSSGTAPRGGDAHVRALLEDASGAGLPGALIEFRWGSESAVQRISDSSGYATLVQPLPLDTPLGAVSVEARYAGSRDQTVGASSNRSTWIVEDSLILEVADAEYVAGQTPPSGRLVDPVSRLPLAGLPVTLTLESDGSVLQRISDGAGRFLLRDASPATADPVSGRIRVTFPGNSSYAPIERTVQVTMRTAVHMDVHAPAHIVSGRPTVVVARLLDARNLSVLDGALVVRLDEVETARQPVEEGLARPVFTPAADLPAATRRLTVDYEGNQDYAPASATFDIRSLAPAALEIKVDPGLPGQTVTVHVKATSEGRPLVGVPIMLNVPSLPSGLVAATGADGVATFELPAPQETLRVSAQVASSERISAAAAGAEIRPSSFIEALAPAATNTLIWILQGALLLVALIVMTFLQLRRNPMAPSLGRARRTLRGRGPVETRILRAYQILQDAAISAELVDAPAATPRVLGHALVARVAPQTAPDVESLIALFEEARYGARAMGPEDRNLAIECLDRITDSLAHFNPFWSRSAVAPRAAPGS